MQEENTDLSNKEQAGRVDWLEEARLSAAHSDPEHVMEVLTMANLEGVDIPAEERYKLLSDAHEAKSKYLLGRAEVYGHSDSDLAQSLAEECRAQSTVNSRKSLFYKKLLNPPS